MRIAVLEIKASIHGYELALRIGVALDVRWVVWIDRWQASNWDIAQRATGFVDEARRPGDERSASRMG